MKNISVLIISMILILSSCSNQEKTSPNSGKSDNPNSENTVLIDIDVKGMTCTGCENTIKTGVAELDGVLEVEASHTDAKTFVRVDTSITSVKTISEMIQTRGYEVESASVSEGEMPHHTENGEHEHQH